MAYPNGSIYVPQSGGWKWNIYEFPPTPPDDVGFLRALIEDLRTRYRLDPARLYMTGHSNGASMTNTFAFYHTKLLAATAPAQGAWMSTFEIDPYTVSPQPDGPLPVWIWRGERETFQTGKEPRPVQDQKQKQYWTWHNEVNPKPEIRQEFDGKYHYTTEIYTGGKAEVRFTEVADQSHNYEPQYTYKIWDEFFARLERPVLGDLNCDGRVDFGDINPFVDLLTQP